MASRANERPSIKRFARPAVLAGIVVPVIAITALHYVASHEHHWVHDILRRAYYLPITVAALVLGLRGALVVAALVSLAYLPHAFYFEHHFDPARGLEKGLEMVLYFIVAAVAGTLSDKEQRRRSQLQASLEEQQSLTKQLVRAGRLSALGEVVAGIAHEIKNPLHALQGTADIVDPLVPKEAEERRMWELHRDELQRLGNVADRFLSFAKPAPIQAVDVNLADVATRLLDLAGAEARQKEIILTRRDPAEPVYVRGDLDQLAQLGLNIVLNAIKAIGTGPGEIRIEVGTSRKAEGDKAFLCIENSGPPVGEEDLEHLFNPFYSKSESTGLGLAISARIAEQHSGTIEVTNRTGRVAFTLFLPLTR